MPAKSHGMSNGGHKIYEVWKGMHARCSYPKCKSYRNYGGRGIYVCQRWSGPKGFQNFLDDMGTPEEGMTLDRIDNDGPYSPGNCRFADRQTQAENSRRLRLITINGKTQHLSKWCREVGVSIQLVLDREGRGWTIEDAITTPRNASRRKPKKLIMINGKEVHLRDVLKEHGIKKATYYARLNRGWSIEDAATKPL